MNTAFRSTWCDHGNDTVTINGRIYTDIVTSFRGHYFFLSNFYEGAPISFEGDTWPSSERLYQAMKCWGPKMAEDKEKIRQATSNKQAKHFGYKITLRPDWEVFKYHAMALIVDMKFRQNKEIRDTLMGTCRAFLLQENTHHDNVWGDCTCERCAGMIGENHLGRLLMRLRKQYIIEHGPWFAMDELVENRKCLTDQELELTYDVDISILKRWLVRHHLELDCKWGR